MRPIGVVVIGFFYMMSMGYYLADTVFLTPAGIDVVDLDGNAIDPQNFLLNDEESKKFRTESERITQSSSNTGTVFDQVLGFSQGGFEAVWVIIGLATGNYFLNVLALLAVPQALIVVLQLIFSFITARTLIYYILGR